jgi:hypothetical protein
VITDFSGRGPETRKPITNNQFEVQRILKCKDSLGPFALGTLIRRDGDGHRLPILVEARFDPSKGLAAADVRGIGEGYNFDLMDPNTHRVDSDIETIEDLVKTAAAMAVDVTEFGEYKDRVKEVEADKATGTPYIGKPDDRLKNITN